MVEIWKDVVGYETLYQVSNLGRVKSLGNDKTKKEKILKLEKRKTGYLQAHLSKNGKTKLIYVHRLVAKSFIENPNNLEQINHKDENKGNNNVNNLEWCTPKYNINYGTRLSKMSNPVLQIDENDNIIAEYESIRCAARMLGVHNQNIQSCCAGKLKTAYNYKWKYKL